MLLFTLLQALKAIFSAEPMIWRVMSAGFGINWPVSGLFTCRLTARLISSQEKPCRLFQYNSLKSSLMTFPYSLPNPAISVANLGISVCLIDLLLLLQFFIHPVGDGGVGM